MAPCRSLSPLGRIQPDRVFGNHRRDRGRASKCLWLGNVRNGL